MNSAKQAPKEAAKLWKAQRRHIKKFHFLESFKEESPLVTIVDFIAGL